ncbi:hypothetical protein FA13DRAFT_1709154 [Coprinellus micaceus]|uniref:Uncharacterized protein n=1 Tax=Coprinellus micaceus TaxID=71717 RepID=A0A4Y7TD48_COPMI|nr:hypothetical protein FA13DRAFT_1709154 [Coprinellus micaceus]
MEDYGSMYRSSVHPPTHPSALLGDSPASGDGDIVHSSKEGHFRIEGEGWVELFVGSGSTSNIPAQMVKRKDQNETLVPWMVAEPLSRKRRSLLSRRVWVVDTVNWVTSRGIVHVSETGLQVKYHDVMGGCNRIVHQVPGSSQSYASHTSQPAEYVVTFVLRETAARSLVDESLKRLSSIEWRRMSN